MASKPSAAERALPGMWDTPVQFAALNDGAEGRVVEAALGRDPTAAMARESIREQLLRVLVRGMVDEEEGVRLSNTGILDLAKAYVNPTEDISAQQRGIIEDLLGDVALYVADQYLESLDDDALFDALETAADEDESCDSDVVAYLAASIRADIEAKVQVVAKAAATKKKKPTTLKKKKNPKLPEKDA
jgi:hypothetical protein